MPKHFLSKIRYLKIVFVIFWIMAISSTKAGIIEGNPNGKITLVEFLDYNCPHCQAMVSVVDEIIKNNPDLRVIYRPIPVLSLESWFAASSVMASQNQKNFSVLHDALLNAHEPLTKGIILNIASNAGINTQRLINDMQSPEVDKELQDNLNVANELGLRNLPTIIIGESSAKAPTAVFYGETPLSQLQEAITQSNAND